MMFDEVDRLREDGRLQSLLAHYCGRGEGDREAWQDRLMEVEDAEPAALVRLHGELLAYGWAELNTAAPAARAGVVPQCYRATASGRRALRECRRAA
jgi:hypothetical protein